MISPDMVTRYHRSSRTIAPMIPVTNACLWVIVPPILNNCILLSYEHEISCSVVDVGTLHTITDCILGTVTNDNESIGIKTVVIN